MTNRAARAALLLAVLATALLLPSAAPVECDPLAPRPHVAADQPGGDDCCAGDGSPCGCCPHLRPVLSTPAVPGAGASPGLALGRTAGPTPPSPDPRGVLHVPRLPLLPTRPA